MRFDMSASYGLGGGAVYVRWGGRSSRAMTRGGRIQSERSESSHGLSVGSISSIANKIPDRSNIAGLQSGVVLVMFAPAEG